MLHNIVLFVFCLLFLFLFAYLFCFCFCFCFCLFLLFVYFFVWEVSVGFHFTCMDDDTCLILEKQQYLVWVSTCNMWNTQMLVTHVCTQLVYHLINTFKFIGIMPFPVANISFKLFPYYPYNVIFPLFDDPCINHAILFYSILINRLC
jgi:hypothetical protein